MAAGNGLTQSSPPGANQMRERLLNAVQENDIATVRNMLSTSASWLAAEDTGVKAAGLAVERGFFQIAHYILGVRSQILNQQTEGNGPTPQDRDNLSQGNSVAPAPRQPVGISSPAGAPAPPVAAPTASNVQAPPPPMPAPANNPFDPNAAPATPLPSSGTLYTPSARTDVMTVPVLPNAPLPISPSAGPTPLEQASQTGSDNEPGFFGKITDGVKGLFGGDEPKETEPPPKKPEEPKAGDDGQQSAAIEEEPPRAAAPDPTPESQPAPQTSEPRQNETPEPVLKAEAQPTAPEPAIPQTHPEQTEITAVDAEPQREPEKAAESAETKPEEKKEKSFFQIISGLIDEQREKDEALAKAEAERLTAERERYRAEAEAERQKDAAARTEQEREAAADKAKLEAEAAEKAAAEAEAQAAMKAAAEAKAAADAEAKAKAQAQAEAEAEANAKAEARAKAQVAAKANVKPARTEPAPAPTEQPAETRQFNAIKPDTRPVPEPVPEQASLPSASNEPLPIDLAIGRFLKIGRPLDQKLIDGQDCFRKGKDKGWFCLEEAEWPHALGEKLQVSAWLYRRARTVVRYEDDRAARMFTVIPSTQYSTAVSHFVQQFGQPARVVDGTIARFGDTPMHNPSTQWERRLAGNKKVTLEVRRFDDVRGMLPDEKVGFVRLYREGSQPIFTYLSDTDLMLHRMRSAKHPDVLEKGK